MNIWAELADQVLEGKEVTNEEALSILECPDDDVLLLMHAAFQIRKRYYGKKVKLNMIINTKSGLCSENCGYCSQSSISNASIDTYRMVDKDTILEGAKRAYDLNIGTYCIVASGRGPSNKELERVVETVKEIGQKEPDGAMVHVKTQPHRSSKIAHQRFDDAKHSQGKTPSGRSRIPQVRGSPPSAEPHVDPLAMRRRIA